MPLFDVAASEAAELARVGWCRWRFGRCGWFCMDRVLVTWTFEAEHRRDGRGAFGRTASDYRERRMRQYLAEKRDEAMKFVAFGVQNEPACRAGALLLRRGGVAVEMGFVQNVWFVAC